MMGESKVQRLLSDTLFGRINPVNTPRLRDQILISYFTLLLSNCYDVANIIIVGMV